MSASDDALEHRCDTCSTHLPFQGFCSQLCDDIAAAAATVRRLEDLGLRDPPLTNVAPNLLGEARRQLATLRAQLEERRAAEKAASRRVMAELVADLKANPPVPITEADREAERRRVALATFRVRAKRRNRRAS